MALRKRIAATISVREALPSDDWIDLEGLAEAEATSEDPNHPLEAALLPGQRNEWRASEEGRQTIRIFFDKPQDLCLIHVAFEEGRLSRTQEFVLRVGSDPDAPFQEIVRQQYNFSPVSSEVEDYQVNLLAVRVLELEIIPLISGGGIASPTELRLR